jgi:hypothetical protein
MHVDRRTSEAMLDEDYLKARRGYPSPLEIKINKRISLEAEIRNHSSGTST